MPPPIRVGGIARVMGREILMQPSTHLDPGVPAYTSITTNDLGPEAGVTMPSGDPESNSNRKSTMPDQIAPTQPGGIPDTEVARQMADQASGNEDTLWEGQPSGRLFMVRWSIGAAFTLAWIILAIAVWGFGDTQLTWLAIVLGTALLIFWSITALTVLRTIQSHHYRLTTRRLFVRTGFFRRRIDQIELLRVKDIFVQQTLLAKWLGVGHAVVISSEQSLPRAVLYGIDRPQSVMDLIWLRTRAELDNKTSRVERV
jgi:hypothetical protein